MTSKIHIFCSGNLQVCSYTLSINTDPDALNLDRYIQVQCSLSIVTDG
jgi:hypothetical protein